MGILMMRACCVVIAAVVGVTFGAPTQKHKIVLIGGELSPIVGGHNFMQKIPSAAASPKLQDYDDEEDHHHPKRRRGPKPPPPLRPVIPRRHQPSPTVTPTSPLLENHARFPSTLQIPLQVAKDVNAMVRVGYWTTRAAFVNYLSKLNHFVGTHNYINDKADSYSVNKPPETLIETLYTLVS